MAAGAVINGKVVAITGGARGIGLATATALHRLGAKVAIGDIDEVAVKEAGTGLGLDVYAKLDVTDRASFEAFLDDVERQLGPLDVLINNAGICPTGKAVDESDEITARTIAINVFGVILGTKLAAARMVKRGKGHVINVASLAAITPMPGIATYCATKHAVLGYTDTVRLELRGSGVAFSSVMPTLTNTAMVDGVSPARGLRNAEPEDIADRDRRADRQAQAPSDGDEGGGVHHPVHAEFHAKTTERGRAPAHPCGRHLLRRCGRRQA